MARADAQGWLLSGAKHAVPAAPGAALWLVSAREPGGDGGDAPGQAQAVSGIRSVATSGERSRVASAEAGPQRTRLGGASRYETAAAIVTWRARCAMPAGPVLRLVSGTRPLDAVAYVHDAAPMLHGLRATGLSPVDSITPAAAGEAR